MAFLSSRDGPPVAFRVWSVMFVRFMIPIKKLVTLFLALALLGVGLTLPASCQPNMGQVAIAVARLLEESHFSRARLDEKISDRILTLFIENLDYNRLFFLESDVEGFRKNYGPRLADSLLLGDVSIAHEIYDIYLNRLSNLVGRVEGLLADSNLIDPNAEAELRRSKSPWPKDEAEQRRIWRNQLAAVLLEERLANNKTEEPEAVVQRRYERLLRTAELRTREAQAKELISAMAQAYDPHSEYHDASEFKSFKIDIGLQLVGIGAMLRADDGYTRVVELVPGGPAATDGRLKIKDRIVGVAQANEPFVDVVDLELDRVVAMIRGKKGTTVRLNVIPGSAGDPSARRVIELVRDEIKLKDKEARAELIDLPDGHGGTTRVGWINVPSFYFDVERTMRPDAPNTTRHVEILLERLKKEGVSGIIIDLSRNGGGALDEAVRLTGLFIEKGYVVQSKDFQGNIRKSSDLDPRTAYDGPLVLLTSRFSASASEIFAAALQDYGRAVVVGDRATFGKGTVQTFIELGNWLPFFGRRDAEDGALRLTIQKFYRISGGSTQFKGVVSDVILPSPVDHEEVGESALRFPLPFDEVDPLPHAKIADLGPVIEQLRTLSAARVAENTEFRDMLEDLQRLRERIESNVLSLDEDARRAEREADKARLKARREARAERLKNEFPSYLITVDNAKNAGLESMQSVIDRRRAEANRHREVGTNGNPEDPVTNPEEEDEEFRMSPMDRPEIDPVRDETLAILLDLIRLNAQTGPVTAR